MRFFSASGNRGWRRPGLALWRRHAAMTASRWRRGTAVAPRREKTEENGAKIMQNGPKTVQNDPKTAGKTNPGKNDENPVSFCKNR